MEEILDFGLNTGDPYRTFERCAAQPPPAAPPPHFSRRGRRRAGSRPVQNRSDSEPGRAVRPGQLPGGVGAGGRLPLQWLRSARPSRRDRTVLLVSRRRRRPAAAAAAAYLVA